MLCFNVFYSIWKPSRSLKGDSDGHDDGFDWDARMKEGIHILHDEAGVFKVNQNSKIADHRERDAQARSPPALFQKMLYQAAEHVVD